MQYSRRPCLKLHYEDCVVFQVKGAAQLDLWRMATVQLQAMTVPADDSENEAA